MKIAHIAPIYAQVPPHGYGGVERVVDEMIQSQMHFDAPLLCLYASNDSQTSVELRSVISSCRSLVKAPTSKEFEELEYRHYTFACKTSDDCHVLHAHGTWILPYAHLTRKPVLVSVYTDTSLSAVQSLLRTKQDNIFLVANSQRTRDKFPEAGWYATVLEGVILEKYPYCEEKGGDLVFVGELTSRKGCHLAIQVALILGMRLKIIGRKKVLDVTVKETKDQEAYLSTSIEPYVDGKQIQYLGEMGEERLEHIKRAYAVLCPIQWEEPFGRIMAESMACGTPVVAMNRGAALEVVNDGTSGFIVEDLASMVQAVREVRHLKPFECREHVYRHLNMERVAQEYFALYSRLNSINVNG